MGLKNVFSNPKPIELIRALIQVSNAKNDDIILDFFSGSATTAHAVMQLNKEDIGNFKFILIQLPEICDEKSEAYKAGYKNICEIGKERIRRAGRKLTEADDQIKFGDDEKAPLDIGFKVFKLDTSNLKAWDSTPLKDGEPVTVVSDRMKEMVNNIKPDRSDLDMVYEVMLKMGVPLTCKVKIVEIDGVKVYSVDGDSPLLICFAENITTENIEKMANYAPAKIILAESSLVDDTAMSNAHYILRDRTIELKLM